MDNYSQKKEKFLYPRSKYYGKFSPKNLIFDANLQEFAQRISYICGLENNGKISPEDAYHQIKSLWKQVNYPSLPSRVSVGLLNPVNN